MTDRYAGFVVTLDEDLREDDAQATIAAIKQIKGVRWVKPVSVNIEMQIAESRAYGKLRAAILDTLDRFGA